MILTLLSDKSDPLAWKEYVKTVSTEDLLLWLDINIGIQEYEICQIVKDEIDKRNINLE